MSATFSKICENAPIGRCVLHVSVRTPEGVVPPGAKVGYRYAGRTRLIPVDREGRRLFTDAPKATLTVLAEAPGYEAVSQLTVVEAGMRTDVVLTLRPED